METSLLFSTRLKRLFLGDISSMCFAIGLVALLLSAGFFFANVNTENYQLMNSHGSQQFWASLFLAYGVARLASSLYRFSNFLRIWLTFIGLSVWSFLFISFLFLDTTPIRPTEIMLALPILVEFWFAVNAIDCTERTMYRRTTDGE